VSWWAVPIVAGLGVLGMLAGWVVGSFLVTFRNEPFDVWEDWEN
jgi:hypothetical protein